MVFQFGIKLAHGLPLMYMGLSRDTIQYIMTVLMYCDDIFFTNDTHVIRLIASLYAVTINNIDSRLEGNPPAFVPIDPTVEDSRRYYDSYVIAFDFLAPLYNH